MQPSIEKKAGTVGRISAFVDNLLGRAGVYAVLSFLAIRPFLLRNADEQLASLLGCAVFPLFEVLVYAAFALVLLCYGFRFAAGEIKRKNPTFLCILGLFAWLQAVTMLYDGASGFYLAWHSGFSLMMMLDMGLQRERKSVIRGLTAALEVWVYVNIASLAAFPGGMITTDILSPGWILGSRAEYYRVVFPALAFALIRFHVGAAGKTRTAALVFACVLTVALQRGGTGLIGFAMLLCLSAWCMRRALPRYVTPLMFTLTALAAFIGIQFFNVHYAFEWLISGVLGKSMTLSNRTDIWQKVMDIVFKNPVTGVGLLPLAYMASLLGGYNHTHNQLLEIMLHGGFTGIALYLGAVYFASREAVAYRRSAAVKTAAILLSVFAFIGVNEMFHNEPIYYALFVLLSRADCLYEDCRPLPRISLKKRILRDLKK